MATKLAKKVRPGHQKKMMEKALSNYNNNIHLYLDEYFILLYCSFNSFNPLQF